MPELVQHKRQQDTVEGAAGNGQCFRASDLPLDRTSLGRWHIARKRDEANRPNAPFAAI
jgi:hypothetical protein